jgi:tetratricopeptide (TPR) repeat protein
VLVVETSAAELGEAAADLLARAWAWVANARRLASDCRAAEAAFVEAEKSWEAPTSRRDRAVRAEMLGIKADLRYSQRRFEEALEILDEAIKESRLAGVPRLEAQALILRATVIDYGCLNRPTIPTLRQALHALRGLAEPRLRLVTHINLAYALNAAGKPRSALDHVAEGWALWDELPAELHDRLLPPQLQWNEALAREALGELEAAETLYEESHGSFVDLGEAEHMAIVALDWARLCRTQGRVSEVLRLASEALPVLGALRIPEAEAALDLLRSALEESSVSGAVLETVRSTLVKLVRAPAAPEL